MFERIKSVIRNVTILRNKPNPLTCKTAGNFVDATFASSSEQTHTPGSIYIISAASGTGKTSLAKALAEAISNIKISISHTTRPILPNEIAGQNYFYISEKQFADMVTNDRFLEYAQVFGYHYGTSCDFVLQQLAQGCDVILDIDWQGALQVQNKLPNCVSIFLLPPSKETLRMRLQARKRDDQGAIEKRLQLASSEIIHYKNFDYIIVNDNFNAALAELKTIVQSRRLRRQIQEIKYKNLITELSE